MSQLPAHLTSDLWVRQIFSSKAAQDGTVVRRKVRDVERLVGRERFELEIRRRGFRAIENGGQYIILCNHDFVRLIE